MIGTANEQRWCSGMKSEGVRPLDDEEREALIALRRHHARRAFAAAVALPGIALTSVVGAMLAPDEIAGAFVCLPLLFGIPAALLVGGESLAAWRTLAADLGQPRAERFVGVPVRKLVQDPAMGALLRGGIIPAEGGELDVLVGSSLPWRANGQPVRTVRPVRIETVACPDETDEHGGRTLTASERAELRERAVRAGRVPMLSWYLGGLATFWAAVIVQQGAGATADYGWRPLVALVLGALAIVGALRRRSRAAALRRDAERGALTVVREGSACLEVLPESGMVWTLDGAPAPHRTY